MGGGAPSLWTLTCEMAFLLPAEASTLIGTHSAFVTPFNANIADQGLAPKPKPTDSSRDENIAERILLKKHTDKATASGNARMPGKVLHTRALDLAVL